MTAIFFQLNFAVQQPLRIFAGLMLGKTFTAYKSAYTGLSRETWLLSLVMLINRCGTMVVPFMSLYLTSIGYSIGKAGFVYGLFGAGSFAGAWVGGRLTDKIGFYPVQLITLSIGGLFFFLLGQMQSFPGICTVAFLLSFINEAFRPANSAAIAFYSTEQNRTRSYSLNRLAINLGWAIGSAVGGLLAKYNYHLLFWVDGITNISAALVMLVFVKPVHNSLFKPKQTPGLQKGAAMHDQLYMWFIVLAALFATCFFQLFTNVSVFYKLNLHFSEPFIGLLMALNGLIIVVIEMVIVYKLEGRRRNTIYIIAGVLLMAASFCMLSAFHVTHVLAFVVVIIITFAEILAMPFMNSFWIARSKPHNRGQYAALYTMSWSVAQTFGPMLGAQLAGHYGFRALWWSITGLSLLTAFGFLRLQQYMAEKEVDSLVTPMPDTNIIAGAVTEAPML